MLENEQGIKANSITDIMGNPIEGISDLPDTEEFFISEQKISKDVVLKKLTFGQARAVLSGAQGKVLTIIDATFTDEKRLKYVKDLVRDAFSKQGDWLLELSMREFDCVNGCIPNALNRGCASCPRGKKK